MQINRFIDHTLLKPDATKSDIVALCEEARAYRFAAVCVNPYWVSFCKEQLAGEITRVATVVGFPLGSTTRETKAFETSEAMKNGASEIDMVINIGALKTGDVDIVLGEIRAVVQAAGSEAIVKVILETSLLTDEEIARGCDLAADAGAHYVKTSTGFGPGGATVEHVRLLKRVSKGRLLVKASGGIRDFETALAMIEAGADRIGTSAGVAIAQGKNS